MHKASCLSWLFYWLQAVDIDSFNVSGEGKGFVGKEGDLQK